MANYLLAFRGGGMPETEKEQARVMAAWGKWYQKLGDAVVDGGNPISQRMTIASTGEVKKGTGRSGLSGYTIIRAKDITTATRLAKGCPILKSGGSIEVCETFDVM